MSRESEPSSLSDRTHSPTSVSSIEFTSTATSDTERSESFSDDDQVVWRLDGSSDSASELESSIQFSSDHEDDFVVLHRPQLDASALGLTLEAGDGQPNSEADLSSAFNTLSIEDRSVFAEDSSSSESEDASHGVGVEFPAYKQKWVRRIESLPESTRSHGRLTPTASYQDAAAFITLHLKDPLNEDQKKLQLLQAIIVELGVRQPSSPDIPTTIKAAKKLLKAEAHINIKEYVAIRNQGQPALQKIMHPSRTALVKSIRKKKNPARLKWVKKQGLQVLLVTCFA